MNKALASFGVVSRGRIGINIRGLERCICRECAVLLESGGWRVVGGEWWVGAQHSVREAGRRRAEMRKLVIRSRGQTVGGGGSSSSSSSSY
jgi:hypothetical protein